MCCGFTVNHWAAGFGNHWSVWPTARREWATFFAREFFRWLKNLGFDLSCCGRVHPQTSLLSQLLSLTLLLVKVVASFYLHNLGVVTKNEVTEGEVPSVHAAVLSYATVIPSSRELQKSLVWSLALL